MPSAARFCYLSCLTLLIVAQSIPLSAEEKKAEEKKAAGKADILASWNKLTDRKNDIFAQLEEFKQKHKKADPEKKKVVAKEFNTLVTELQQDVYGELGKLAPEVLELQPENVDAADLVMEQAFQKNQFQKVATIADQILKAGKSSPGALNFGGVAHFAIHDFAKAKELLSRAEKEHSLSLPLAGRLLPRCDDYVTYWEKEKKIRAAEAKADDLPRVVLDTTQGRIVLELFENEAPNTVANFIDLVESGTYDGTSFHRVIPAFMTQGGRTGVDFTIDCECDRDDQRNHFRGSLSMAKTAEPNSGSSQFFLTHLPTDHLNGKHTVFGRIIEGLEVNEAIERGDVMKTAKVLRKRKHPYKPKRN